MDTQRQTHKSLLFSSFFVLHLLLFLFLLLFLLFRFLFLLLFSFFFPPFFHLFFLFFLTRIHDSTGGRGQPFLHTLLDGAREDANIPRSDRRGKERESESIR